MFSKRPAYHQGQWDMAGRINKAHGLQPHPGASKQPKAPDTLDKQLDSVVRYVLEQGMLSGNSFLINDGVNKSIAQIKAAFQEAGYIQHDEYGVVQVYTHNATDVMTGAEFYDRFKAELDKEEAHHEVWYPGDEDIEQAAKRAANLEDTE